MLLSEAQSLAIVRPNLLKLIKKKHPNISLDGYISRDEMKRFREEYIQSVLATERGEISKLNKKVIRSMVSMRPLLRISMLSSRGNSSSMRGFQTGWLHSAVAGDS